MFRTPSAGRVSWDWARLAARTTRRLVLGATMLALAHCGGGSVPTSEVPSPDVARREGNVRSHSRVQRVLKVRSTRRNTSAHAGLYAAG